MDAKGPMQHYNLKWNNFTDNMLQIFSEQLYKELLTDVTISCEGKLVKAHRIVLSACSLYFQNLFEVYSVANPLIILHGVKLDDLKQILTFMYLGEIKVSEENINTILTLANDFQVKGLSNIIYNNGIEKKYNSKSEQLLQSRSSSESNPTGGLSGTNLKQEPDQKFFAAKDNFNNAPNRQTASPALSTDSNVSDSVKPVRPLVAFMIFTTEWRAKLSEKYPNENNKEISVRLSTMWKRLAPHKKSRYYYLARKKRNDQDIEYNPTPTRRKKEQPQKPMMLQKQLETDEDLISNSRDSSDGLEIVEDAELIEIVEGNDGESSRSSTQTNHQLQGSTSSSKLREFDNSNT